MFALAMAVGVVFAVIGIRQGFYRSWAILFNILISIYLAVMLTPVMYDVFAEMDNFKYSGPACVFSIGAFTFAVLQMAAIVLTGTFEVSLPRFFNTFGAGVLGFISGYLVIIFVSLVICVSPFESQGVYNFQQKLRPTVTLSAAYRCM